MNAIAAEIFEIQSLLNEVYAWVEKNRIGLTREDAKRIFHRYRAEKGPAPTDTSPDTGQQPPAEQDPQARQISQILSYMEDTNHRLDQIENDIGYIKDRVDAILRKL